MTDEKTKSDRGYNEPAIRAFLKAHAIEFPWNAVKAGGDHGRYAVGAANMLPRALAELAQLRADLAAAQTRESALREALGHTRGCENGCATCRVVAHAAPTSTPKNG